ncbi:ABC transporter substrate-binding protein (plasmid) [Rhizobium sp. WYJ-E13]|nr:ABC transporter substrate-binding protein [Rhizobium sp. WYJ-E13]
MAQQIDDMISFDPGESFEASANELEGNCYCKLVRPDVVNPSEIVGDVAESWSISPDGRVLTFNLRKDCLFDSGRALTAHDAVFSLKRLIVLNKSPAFIIAQFGFTAANVEELIVAKDDHTLEITLPSPQAPSFVLSCLTSNPCAIVEKERALANQQGGDLGNGWLKTNSAGAGPFRLVSWTASDRVILEANPHFAGSLAVKRLVVRHIKDPEAQYLALQQGDVDIARDLGSDRLRSLTSSTQFHAVSQTQLTSLYIAMNVSVPEFAKNAVQQAVKWAIDYEGIAQNLTPLVWDVSQSFLPSGVAGALNETPFRRDVAKAKALLAEAGLAEGFSIAMDHYAASPYAEIAQAVQQNLREIGITVSLLPGEQKQVVTKTRARNHQLALLVWNADYFDPHSNAQAFCQNTDDRDESAFKMIAWRSHFQDAELSASVEIAAREVDAAARIERYQSMQRLFWERAPFAFLLQRKAVAMVREETSGMVLGPMPAYTRYEGLRKT